VKLFTLVAFDLGELIEGEADGSLIPQASYLSMESASLV